MILTELRLADPPDAWEALGLAVSAGFADLGGVRLRFMASHPGPVYGPAAPAPSAASPPTAAVSEPPVHPNGATAVDHFVIVTPDFDAAADALARDGLTLRRIRDAGGFRQGFRRVGPAILELVETERAPRTAFWGVTITVADLDALKRRLGERLGTPKPAVQAGRRIATVRSAAGLSTNVAFMTPEVDARERLDAVVQTEARLIRRLGPPSS